LKINIFIIILEFSGVKTYIDELVSYLQNKNNLIIYEIFLNAEYKEFKIFHQEKLNKIYIPENKDTFLNSKYNFRAAQLIKINLPKLENVIVHANAPAHHAFAQHLKKIYHCPILYTWHFLLDFYSYNIKYPRKNISELIERFDKCNLEIINSSDYIICVTNFSRKVLIKHFNFSSDKISVIYNYKKICIKDNSNINYLKLKYGFKAEDRIILFVGRLDERKGVDNLINIFDILKDKFDSIKLVIAGSGDFDKYLSTTQKTYGKTHFVGNLPKEILYDFYRFCEIGVIPSRYEQCSYVAIEMINFCLPIVVSNVPGLNELFSHNKTALLCKMKKSPLISNCLELEENDLIDKISSLLNNKVLAYKIANNAKISLEKYAKMGEETYAVYKSLITTKDFIKK